MQKNNYNKECEYKYIVTSMFITGENKWQK